MKAKPEQGEVLPHSLVPALSIVVTSTTPGPFAELAVHTPVVALPPTQIEVNDGEAMRLPRAALAGLTNAGFEAT